jgi:hypothetical protein
MTLATKLDPILEPTMAAVRHAERFFGPEDDWVEDDRRILYESAQRHLGHLHTFIAEKHPDEYVTTVKASPDEVEEALMGVGSGGDSQARPQSREGPYQRNLVSNRKYRTYHGGGKQWACGSFAIDGITGPHGYTEQHHVYLFETEEGHTDVHAHRETSVTEGAEHLTDSHQEDGDPHVLFGLFDRNGLAYEHRNY